MVRDAERLRERFGGELSCRLGIERSSCEVSQQVLRVPSVQFGERLRVLPGRHEQLVVGAFGAHGLPLVRRRRGGSGRSARTMPQLPTGVTVMKGRRPMTDDQFPADSFPRQQARTRRYTLGRPRTFAIAEDGSRVAFLRSRSSDDPVGCLWVFDVAAGAERLVVDPAGAGDAHLSAEERDRRERRRESLIGVTDYAADRVLSMAAFAMDGGLFVADLVHGGARPIEIGAAGPVRPAA